jgi:hypothetical protein
MPTLAEQVSSLNLPPMNEEELAKYCGLSMAQWEKYKPQVSADDLEMYEQMRAVELLCPLWQSGIEPYPSDVSVNRGRPRKKRKSKHQRDTP